MAPMHEQPERRLASGLPTIIQQTRCVHSWPPEVHNVVRKQIGAMAKKLGAHFVWPVQVGWQKLNLRGLSLELPVD